MAICVILINPVIFRIKLQTAAYIVSYCRHCTKWSKWTKIIQQCWHIKDCGRTLPWLTLLQISWLFCQQRTYSRWRTHVITQVLFVWAYVKLNIYYRASIKQKATTTSNTRVTAAHLQDALKDTQADGAASQPRRLRLFTVRRAVAFVIVGHTPTRLLSTPNDFISIILGLMRLFCAI